MCDPLAVMEARMVLAELELTRAEVEKDIANAGDRSARDSQAEDSSYDESHASNRSLAKKVLTLTPTTDSVSQTTPLNT